jgi:hypothetical protein
MKKFYITLIILFSASLIYWMYRLGTMSGDPFTDPALYMGALILIYLSIIIILLLVLLKNRK